MKKFLAINLLVLLLVSLSGCQTSPETADASPVPMSIATLASTPTPEPSPTATEKVLTLEEKVDAFRSGEIEFPTDLFPEEYSAFIDGMNDRVGRQPIWVESFDNKTKAPVVLYFDIAKTRMVKLPGSYAENKAVIDQNALEMFVKIGMEPGTGNIQFTNSSGELVTSPNSAGTDWNLRVDETNYKSGLIDLPKAVGKGWNDLNNFWLKMFEIIDEEITFIPGILMDNTVSDVVSNQGGWSQYPCLDILFIKTDGSGSPIYGVRTMVGPAPATYLGEEGGTIDGTPGLFQLRATDTIKKFEAGAVHYVGVAKQQQLTWDQYNRADIDELQGADSESGSFDNAFNQDVPDDGNIILAGLFFIKKK